MSKEAIIERILSDADAQARAAIEEAENKAAEILARKGIRVRIDHHPSLKPFDRELVRDLASKVPAIVTCENHCISGGLFSLVAETLVQEGYGTRVMPIGSNPDDFIHTGHVNDLAYHYRMRAVDIAGKVEYLLRDRI